MKIGVFTYFYPAWCETFVRREVEALAAMGNEVIVFRLKDPPPGPQVTSPVKSYSIPEAENFDLDVLYGSLAFPAHEAMYNYALKANKPFVFRLWSGLDVFQYQRPAFYNKATQHPLCKGTIVEDQFMEDYVKKHLEVRGEIFQVPNSLLISSYPFTPLPEKPVILAVGRFIEKKGFIYLIRAARILPEYQFILVGDGELMTTFRMKTNRATNISLIGTVDENSLKLLYRDCYMLVAPCVMAKGGDADGVPTVVLEAMACGRPVVGSDLYSMSQYVTSGVTGQLVMPANTHALVNAIQILCEDRINAQAMGTRAREWAENRLDINHNITKIWDILATGSGKKWQAAVDIVEAGRTLYGTPERLAYYAEIHREAFAAMSLHGSCLDIGCGDGRLSPYVLETATEYTGVDVVIPESSDLNLGKASGEKLPYEDEQFDSVLAYSVLQHVEHPEVFLSEMRRVLKQGGAAGFQICLDSNPIFMWLWNEEEATALVAKYFQIRSTHLIKRTYSKILVIDARRNP